MDYRQMKLKIETATPPRRTSVWLNETRVPVNSLNLDLQGNQSPIVMVELPIEEQDIDVPNAIVTLHYSTRELLKQLGWSPPLIEDPGVPQMATREFRMLALLIMASGGEITVTERDMVGTDFDDLYIETVRNPTDHSVTYRIRYDPEGNSRENSSS